MLQLEFTKVTATLENLNCRTEKIGPDKVPAADLKVSLSGSADVLAFFSPTLKALLFDAAQDLAGETMRLRDSHMVYPLQRDEEMSGASVMIDFGLGDPMTFPDAKVNQFRITPVDGGSVTLGFRVQCKPDEKQIGVLYTMQERGITFTLTPAELPTMAEAAE